MSLNFDPISSPSFICNIDETALRFMKGSQTTHFMATIDQNNAAFLDGHVEKATEHSAQLSSTIQALPLTTALWHSRFAHHSHAAVKKLASGSMVNGLELVAQPRPDPVCVSCLAGKMNANPFPPSVNHSSLPLERIHSDLHELKTLTISGFCYWVTFIDDATGHHAVTFLRKKSDAFDAFRAFKALAKNLLDAKIKELQMDQGFVSGAFRQFCSDAGILMRFATRKQSQQNGVAERANRTIDEHTTAMLSESGLPPSFKGEAVAAYIHIWNCLPTTASYDPSQTPYKLWHKRKPEVGHLRVWGCTAYVHVQKDEWTHMEKCVFIGYPIGWKFYNPTTRKVVISERAEFDERFFPELKSNANTPSMPSLVPAVDTLLAPYVDDAEDEYPVWPIPPNRFQPLLFRLVIAQLALSRSVLIQSLILPPMLALPQVLAECLSLHLLSETSVLPEMYLRLRGLSLSLGEIHLGTDNLLATFRSSNLVLMLKGTSLWTWLHLWSLLTLRLCLLALCCVLTSKQWPLRILDYGRQLQKPKWSIIDAIGAGGMSFPLLVQESCLGCGL